MTLRDTNSSCSAEPSMRLTPSLTRARPSNSQGPSTVVPHWHSVLGIETEHRSLTRSPQVERAEAFDVSGDERERRYTTMQLGADRPTQPAVAPRSTDVPPTGWGVGVSVLRGLLMGSTPRGNSWAGSGVVSISDKSNGASMNAAAAVCGATSEHLRRAAEGAERLHSSVDESTRRAAPSTVVGLSSPARTREGNG